MVHLSGLINRYANRGRKRIRASKGSRNLGSTSSYTRNPQGKLLASLAFAYDQSGNPTKRQTGQSEQRYQYDALSRLTQVQFANRADTYTYDAAGNRATKNGATYTYNDLGELTAAPGGKTYSYDPQGRRTAKTTPQGAETYSWNSIDQLTARTTPDAKTYSYAFDALGRMTSTQEGGFPRTYNYGASDSPTSILTALSGAAGSQLRREEFSYGPGGLLEARVNDQAPKYPIADRLGTLTGEVSDRGEVSMSPELDPFGVPVTESSALAQIDQQTLGFLGGAGREALPDSGLVKMGARMYEAETGAFVTRDRVTGEPAEPARRVPYAYAFNGPGRYVDLDGLSVGDGFKSTLFPTYPPSPWDGFKDWIGPKAVHRFDILRDGGQTVTEPFALWKMFVAPPANGIFLRPGRLATALASVRWMHQLHSFLGMTP